MQNVSENYLNLINDIDNIGRSMKNKVVIDNVEYFSDIIKSNPKISHKATSFMGGFPAKTCEFEIFNLDGSLSLNNKEIEVYKGLEINGSMEWVKQGIFKAKDEDITTNLTTKSIHFKGKDRRTLFDEIYESDLPYPATGLQIIQDICNKLGVTLETPNFNMANYVFTKKPNFSEATTFTEAVARMAEAGGEIAYISRNGGLRIEGQKTTGQTIPRSKRSSLTKEKQFGVINTIVLGMDGYDDDIVYKNTEMINTGIEKNKIDISKYEKTSYHQGDFELNEDTLKITVSKVYSAINNFIVQYKMQLKPNTKYTFSWDCNKSNDAQAARWYFYADRLWGSKSLGSGAENGASKTITTDATGLVVAGLYITTNVVVGDTITISNLQIEEGSSKTSYEKVIAAGIIEWKITNNPYFDLNREEIIETIAKNIIGKSVIPYTIDNFIDDFIYDLNDVVSAVDNEGNTFDAVILQYETVSRIKSNIAVPAQTETTTNYNAAGNKNSNNVAGSVKLIVNHLEKMINAIAEKLIDTTEYIKTVTGQGFVHLDKTAESNAMIKKLVIKGFSIQPLYLGDKNYFSENTYLGASTHYCILERKANANYSYNPVTKELTVDKITYENGELTIDDDLVYENGELIRNSIRHDIYISKPLNSGIFNNILVTDDLVIENNKCYVIRRLGYDANNKLYVLDETITEEYGEVVLSTFEENTYILMEKYTDVSFECLYMQENEYVDYFATEVLYNSNFSITDNNINSKVSKNHIVSEINQSSELIKILANKIELEGYTTINGGFAVDEKGNASIANGSVKINEDGIQMATGTKVVGGDGLLTNLQDESEWTWLGYDAPESTAELTAVKTKLKVQTYIPDNFKVVQAKLTLIHAPIHYVGNAYDYETSESVEYDYWGYSRNIRLYQNTDADYSVTAAAFSEFDAEDNSSYAEIENAFGKNGFTAEVPTDDNHKTQTVTSIDFAEYLQKGFNEFMLESADVPPVQTGDFVEQAVYSRTGRAFAVLSILGYMSV